MGVAYVNATPHLTPRFRCSLIVVETLPLIIQAIDSYPIADNVIFIGSINLHDYLIKRQPSIYANSRTNWVYIITRGDCVLYVGQTVIGVKKRMWQHISNCDAIGSLIKTKGFENFDIHLVKVRSGLSAAEKHFIQNLAATINKHHGVARIPDLI